MKLTVKTLKGSHFEIRVQPFDTIMAVKKNIEDIRGKDNYPCGQQLLIHNGKVLEDESTLAENKSLKMDFLLSCLARVNLWDQVGHHIHRASKSAASDSEVASARPSDTYGQVASNLVAGNNLEQTIQQIMDMGGGNWDKETITRALRAAYNNPERAVDYLYYFQALRSMVQANPHILQPMLQELGKQNPQLLRRIEEQHAEFLQLINEPVEGSEGDLLDQPERTCLMPLVSHQQSRKPLNE